MSLSPRPLAAIVAVSACLLAACGATPSNPVEPSESLATTPTISGVAASTPSAAATTSPSPTSSPSATPSSGPPVKGGPCNSCGTVANGSTAAMVVDATDQDVFSPETVTIKVGQVVEWKNTGIQTHSVTFTSDSGISDALLTSGKTWEIKFTKAGSFAYECTFHVTLGMIGTVVVTSS